MHIHLMTISNFREETYSNGPNVRPVPGDAGLTPIVDEEIELNR